MAQTEKEDYSHQQDMEQFNQTLTTLRERYDDNRRAGIASDNEAEFVAYRLILASLYANSQLENELHSLPSDLRNNKRVLIAIEIFKAAKSAFNFGSDKGWIQAQANWKKFWDLIKSSSVSYLMACAAEISFNRVRHVILDSLWHAYRKGPRGDITVEAWTTDRLKDVLAMDDDKDAVKLCELYGFPFERSAEGHTYLDIAKLGNSNKSLGVPHSIKPQMFSQGLVESKRHNRAFSAIIQGMTVQQAKSNGLLVDPSTVQMGGGGSLFIPDTTAVSKPNIFGQNSNGATTNGATKLSPFASPFQPPSQTSSRSTSPNPFGNPFAGAAPQSQPAQASPSSAFGGGASAGLFDATKTPIKFAPTPASSNNNNPFAAAAAKFPPQSTTPASTPPGSFNFGTNASTAPQGQSSASQANLGFGQANAQPTSDAPKPFTFPGLPAIDAKLQSEQQAVASSATPAGSPPPDAAALAAEKQRAEDEAREAVRRQRQEAEERRKREQEEQDRRAREAQQAREAEQRRIEEEKQRQLREQQQRELRAKQERERLIMEEQQRQQQQEQERVARIHRRETAYDALTSSIVFSGEDGLLYQFLENTVKNTAEQVAKEVQAKKQRDRELAEKEKRNLALARAVFVRWVTQVQKKKRTAKARDRRKRLKAQRVQSLNGEGEGESGGDGEAVSRATIAHSARGTDQPNGASTTRNAPTNGRRARRTQERHTNATADRLSHGNAAASPTHAQNSSTSATMKNGHHVRSYSEAYQKSTAPIDRTETDWFKLRAMGIDPSKHRKRSFDSATDEEAKGEAEAKRVRRSDSSTSLTSQPQSQPEAPSKPLTIEERLARIRAAKQSFKSSGSGSPPVNGATPNKRSSFSGRSSLLIAQARDLIAKSPTAKHSPSAVHDFGRSVPNLGASSSFRQSSFGKSLGAVQSDQPAYRGRASRFVPQHLYGKGPEAIRAYREQYVNSPTSTPRPLSTDPLALSSPIPTQLSYVPQPGYTQPQYSEGESASGVDLIDVSAEENIAGDTEEDSFDGDDEEVEEDPYDEEDEDEGEETEEDNDDLDTNNPHPYDSDDYTSETSQPFAQPGSIAGIGPGATQDDAIELSD